MSNTEPNIVAIAAISHDRRALGNKGKLLWQLPGDLARVKALTMGSPLIMGRKTHESIGRALPGRTNIVITSSDSTFPGCLTVHSLDEALTVAKAEGPTQIFIFGGAQIYEQALPLVRTLYLTVVDDEPEADAFFPAYQNEFAVIDSTKHSTKGLTYHYQTLRRK